MSSVTVQEVVAKFTADDSNLQAVSKRAIATLAKFSVVGVGVAAAALTGMTRRSMDAADKMAKLAASLGVDSKQFQAMALYGEEAGVTVEKLGSSMTLLQRNLVDAAQGGQATSDAMKLLGLNAEDLLRLTPDQQFMAVADALNAVENTTLKTATAMDLFGRGGREVINMLGGLREGTKEALEFQEKFNLNLSRIDSSMIEEANDAMGRVAMTLDGVGNTVAVKVSPLLTALSNQMIEASPSARGFGESIDSGLRVAAVSLDVLRAGFLGIQLLLKEAMVGIASLFANFERGINRIKNDEFLKKALGTVGVKMAAPSNEAQLWAESWKDSANETIDAIKNMKTTVDMMDEARRAAEEKAKARAAELEKMLSGLKDFNIETQAEKEAADKALKDHEKALKDLQDQYDSLGKTASDSFYDILTGAQSMGDGVRGILNSILKSVYDATIGKSISSSVSDLLSSTGMLGGGIGDFFSGIFSKNASGGVVSGPTMFPIGTNVGLMGEAGAEAIMPLTRKGGKLGVANHGGGGTTVNQTINISTGVQQTVRAEIARLLPEISAQSVKAVQDASRRNMLKV